MPKNSEIVSRVQNQLNMLSKDMRANKRFIINTAKSISNSYISKRLRDMSLNRHDNLYRPIECVEMIEANVFECGVVEFKSCDKLMRSKKKLPELIYSRLGASIRDVTSIDNIYEFKPSTLQQYRRDKERKSNDGYVKYYVKDQYLWIPDSTQKMVEIDILSPDQYELMNMSECCKDCKSYWEYDFIVPSDLEEQVIKETTQQIYLQLQIPKDEKPNLDSNQKSQTV